jgi:hypothetical protein
METEFRAFISNFPFLDADEAEIIIENTILREFNKGHILLEEGRISKECYAVIRGCIREFYLKDGLEKTTAFFTEGQSVNSLSSYTNQVPSKQFLYPLKKVWQSIHNGIIYVSTKNYLIDIIYFSINLFKILIFRHLTIIDYYQTKPSLYLAEVA